MKKLLIILILLLILSNINDLETVNETRGVFISYIELSEYIKDYKEEDSKNNIDKMINNIKSYNLNTIILQVRVSSDAIYDSNIFPYSKYITNDGKSYDVLDYFIKEAHNSNLRLYAWINPYRVETTNNIDLITKGNPAYKYIGTDNIYISNGIYYNPAKKEVVNLIVDGVEEVLNYNIDGLLFDDYFYQNTNIDYNDYKKYLIKHPNISLEEYRLNNVNNLVKAVYSKCKEKNVKFGISPDGNIDNNYQKNMADIRSWMSEDNYIDFIIPQLYYGFNNEAKSYPKAIAEWQKLIRNDDLEMLIGLAAYKIGKEDIYAKGGRKEWIENNNILMKEVILARNINNYKGFVIFRYDNLFNKDTFTNNNTIEISNLKKVIK